MSEAIRALINVPKYSSVELEEIAQEFGYDWPIQCRFPVGVLIRAHKEYENLKRLQAIVVLAEELVNYTGFQESSYFQAMYLSLCQEVNNLRSYNRAAAKKAGQNPG